MRLFEVDNKFADDLVLAIRNQLGRSNQEKAQLVYTWPAFNNILKNMDYPPIDSDNLDTFKKLLDSNPQLNKLVRTFDDKGVVIDTLADKPEGGIETPGGKSVDQMAKSGVKDFYKDIT